MLMDRISVTAEDGLSFLKFRIIESDDIGEICIGKLCFGQITNFCEKHNVDLDPKQEERIVKKIEKIQM